MNNRTKSKKRQKAKSKKLQNSPISIVMATEVMCWKRKRFIVSVQGPCSRVGIELIGQLLNQNRQNMTKGKIRWNTLFCVIKLDCIHCSSLGIYLFEAKSAQVFAGLEVRGWKSYTVSHTGGRGTHIFSLHSGLFSNNKCPSSPCLKPQQSYSWWISNLLIYSCMWTLWTHSAWCVKIHGRQLQFMQFI